METSGVQQLYPKCADINLAVFSVAIDGSMARSGWRNGECVRHLKRYIGNESRPQPPLEGHNLPFSNG